MAEDGPTRMAQIMVPISIGELIDKVTVLELKVQHIQDASKRTNVLAEHAALNAIMAPILADAPEDMGALVDRLREVNATLWQVEDEIRNCERTADFGPRFVALARSVYVTNDQRAALKRALSVGLGSTLIEEKSYSACPPAG
jgi:hypothetical protein